ncbi:MAG: hypothetical protein IT238_03645 [Bacteroidia bacterium]|nr:hypothetical protein [Bacteroidia bacterium]MCZ2247856.1 hypothetical protein [Bacteroidia bacterium]
MPLKLVIKIDRDILIAQATEQEQLPLNAKENDVFTFGRAGIILEFNPEKNVVALKQG